MKLAQLVMDAALSPLWHDVTAIAAGVIAVLFATVAVPYLVLCRPRPRSQ